MAEDGLIPRDAIVVSLEASRALATSRPGAGVVVRPGDLYNTFSNDGERFLRVGRERLAEAGIPLLEMAYLEDLSREKVYEFAFIGACLKIRGGTGSPMRPIALPLRS